MKLIKKAESKRRENGENCIAFEYPLGSKEINQAVIEIFGRYPSSGRVMNTACEEVVYVIDGSGSVEVNGEQINLEKQDMLLINKDEKYFFDGNLQIIAACSPAWHPEQHKEVE